MALDVPVEIGRGAAREAALRELADPAYPKPSWADLLLDRIWQFIQDLINRASGVPGGWLTLLVLVLILAVIAFALIRAARKASGAGRQAGGGLFGETRLGAAEHRVLAERHAAAGEWAQAIRERLRAIARELEERTIVEPMPGRTATELAAEAGQALPALAGDLSQGARIFADVTYGDRPGTPESYAALTELDVAVRRENVTLR
ncbi:DUF4129 domain-containing protein [Herbidospora mongoliensis]|uniref:DUF4129 domain-containing protein n=1 Tax=Herbidospora mongoliensis TaxID=688067 RepID=UPI00082B544C|nr:DUF4129 domain-containing protein [Herbidospora mongoliensis]